MTTPFPIAFLAALVLTAIAHGVMPAGRPRLPVGHKDTQQPAPVGMGLWVGMLLTTAMLGILQPRLPLPVGQSRGVGPGLLLLVVAVLPLLVAALPSDLRRPRSERHAAGLALSGVGLGLVGYSIFIVTTPFEGTVAVAPIMAIVFTVLWLFLLASIIELVSLVPAGVTLLGLAIAGVVWLSGGPQQTVASYALAGMIAGAIVGRALADIVLRRGLAYGKAEVFVLGFFLTAMTNAAFLKSVALAGFVLPLGAIAVGTIVVMIRGFERSLLLRDTPGAQR